MPAIKGQIYNDYLTLPSFASFSFSMQVTPTIVAGDVKVVKDGGAPANIATLPTVSGTVVTYTLSATETNADSILVLFKDQAGDEWVDVTVKIETEASGGGGLTLAEIEASTVLAKEATLSTLSSTNQSEHDATQSAIAAIPPPLDSTATQAAAAAALVAYDGVVVSDLSGLATATNVTNAQTAIIAEIDASGGGGLTLAEIEASTVLAKEATLSTLSSTNQSEHDATQSAIAAIPPPLDSTATQAAAAAALVAYDGVVVSDLSGLATATNVTNAQTAIIAEIDAIPTNPLLMNDARLNNLDAAVSTRLASASYTAPIAAGTIADAVWDESYSTHTTAGTFGKLMDTLRKSNLQIDGLVNDAAATVTSFNTNLTHATGAHDHQILLFVSGALEGESRPILTYNNTNGLITLQEPLTVAPANGSEFVILIQHVHPVGEISDAVRDELATELGRVDVAISSRLASASYVAPSNSDITAIKAKTDNLTFSQAGIVDANIQYVNDVQVKGTGTELDPWNPNA